MHYQPIYNREDLILGEGKIIVVTGWTPAKLVASSLTKRNIPFACIGNLYNAYYGLTPLIANLLYNEECFPIHILAATKQDDISHSSLALYQLLTGHFYCEDLKWVVKSPSNTTIGECDGTILKEDIESLKGPTYLWSDLNLFYKEMGDTPFISVKKRDVPPKYYTFIDKEQKYNPGPQVGLKIEGDTIFSCWVKLLHAIYYTGYTQSNRKELLNVLSIVHFEASDFSGIHNKMPITREATEEYCKQILDPPKVDQVGYTYGSRLRRADADSNPDIEGPQYIDQLREVIYKLIMDPNTNRAVMSLWVPKQDVSSEQPPCLNQIQVKLVDNSVVITAVFRSHDAYSAYCSNLFALKAIQDYIVSELNQLKVTSNVTAGDIVCLSQAAHIYRWSINDTTSVLETSYPPKDSFYNDPVGNFTLKIVDNLLHIMHTTPKGQYVRKESYDLEKRVSSLSICKKIAEINPAIRATHLAYLGIEISKAIECYKERRVYHQDQ